jgi:uncharacterized protein
LSSRILRVIKPEIRILGVDDGKFVPHSKTQVLVVGVVFRAGYWLEGVMSTRVAVDGFDGTAKMVNMIKGSPHYKQLRVIMLNGITLGGFNVVDIKALNEQTGLPVIAVTSRKPNLAKVHSALKNLPKSDDRWNSVLNAGEIFPVVTRGGKQQLYVEIAGITKEVAVGVLRLTATRSKIPEPLRVAHLVASGISLY